MWKAVWKTEENKCHHIGAWGYKITLHPSEDLHSAGNRKKHLPLCNDLGRGDFQRKAVTLAETVSTLMLQAKAASNSRAMLACALLDQPPIRIQPDYEASCYVSPQHWKQQHETGKVVTHGWCIIKLFRSQQANVGCQEETLTHAHAICFGET